MALEQTGFERLTGLSAIGFLTIPSKTTHAWLQAEAQNVRIRFDQANPTATAGAIIRADDPPIELPVDLIKQAKVIEVVAGASLSVTYFGNS